jgi:hypothetical protein
MCDGMSPALYAIKWDGMLWKVVIIHVEFVNLGNNEPSTGMKRCILNKARQPRRDVGLIQRVMLPLYIKKLVRPSRYPSICT